MHAYVLENQNVNSKNRPFQSANLQFKSEKFTAA